MSDAALIAERAALVGGRVVAAARARVPERKGAPGDYVTSVDRESEEAITAFLARETPDVPLLGEEGGWSAGEAGSGRAWVVDPLDGTTNFLHGFPVVAVSVALIEGGEPVAGAVHAPFLGETYVGAKGEGARLRRDGEDDRPLAVSGRRPDEAVVGTGFPFRDERLAPRYLAMFERALSRFEDLRRPGAAALDLAWTAAGVFDGFFELNLSAWDVAAGALLVREAGGVVTDWEGGDRWLSGDILAAPPQIHAALLNLATA